MSTSDRKPYETATVLDQDLLNNSHDNLACQLEMVCDIETPTGFIRASDRNKYVGGVFYEALLTFPTISRTVGMWLSTELEFSVISIEVNNVDGRFNDILPGGANYGEWIGKSLEVSIGLRDVSSTYTKVFSGFITDVQGFGRTVRSITLKARDRFDSVNLKFPTTFFESTTYPALEDALVGKLIPVIYGDWTTNLSFGGASVPAFTTNRADVNVIGGTRNNIQLTISSNANASFDTSGVFLFRSSEFFPISASDITAVSVGNNSFEIIQNGVTLVNGSAFTLNSSDKFFCKVQGKDLGAYDDNIIEIARDILITYGGVVAGDFDSSWDTFRDKAAPAESAISTFKARVWIQKPQEAMQYVLSLLEQVRLEVFVDRNLKLKINSLHFDDFVAPASIGFSTRNWDVVKGSFRLKIDSKNNFNRAKGFFNWLPDKKEEENETSYFKNTTQVTNVDRPITKDIIFPNLYEQATVDLQVQEFIKLASAFMEIIEAEFTWRSLLLDIGDFVKLNVSIQGVTFSEIPAMIREIGYDPRGFKIPMKLFNFLMVPFPGYAPPYPDTAKGGSTAIIEEE